ncbi:uncharacterized protein LOC129315945 isoform X1 [Prosopis cineraria]|uniref:uncharacterized protein LOC129315945 isoform X1 n=1 Tax=Prosopis cineraria TaxID=364024 RepID=UPI0024108998|nr:uncharacterized protein LOC129315945 isoform X1 [Prosopis cineraria]
MDSPGSGSVDCGVGSIVWVRRRNGSWWPGQILGPEELSSSHLTSPRSGTPVKLLGREDASVRDWYNLEKSKRVKAFRCGEFDDCIERAESSQGMPIKKREKYARREDAILHALELEKQLLKKDGKSGVGQTGVDYRAKRSRSMYLPAESSDSLDYKEPPSHVDMSSSQFGGEGPHPSSLAEESESAFMDDVESDSSDTGSTDSDSDSDSSETEPDMDEEMALLSEPGRGAEEHGSTSSEEPDELAISSDMRHIYPRNPITSNEAVSKWQLKGKRNSRNLMKRSVGAPDGRVALYGADAEGRSHLSHKRLRSTLHYYRNDFTDVFDEADQMFGLEDDYSPSYRATSKGRNNVHRGVDWTDWDWDDQPALKGYWDAKVYAPVYGDRHHFNSRMRSPLVNVDLKVQASYRKEPVPIVSLMSKVDGKAIIGHPIQIDVLPDGSSDSLVSTFDYLNNDGIGVDGSSMLPPAWRTARRTANFRVPRPPVSSSNGAEASAELSFLDQERRFEYKKLNAGSFSHKASLSRKSSIDSPRPSTDRKPSKKMPKKASLSSSQKTRTLSSLSIEHSLSRKPLHDSISYQTDRLIKPDVSGPTTVACIPVKLVFSRLLEKINRPPSKVTSNASLLNTVVERNS